MECITSMKAKYKCIFLNITYNIMHVIHYFMVKIKTTLHPPSDTWNIAKSDLVFKIVYING